MKNPAKFNNLIWSDGRMENRHKRNPAIWFDHCLVIVGDNLHANIVVVFMYFLDVCWNFFFLFFLAFRTFSAIFDKKWGSFQLPVLLKSRLFQVFRYQRAAVSGEWVKVYTRKTGGGGVFFSFMNFCAPLYYLNAWNRLAKRKLPRTSDLYQ